MNRVDDKCPAGATNVATCPKCAAPDGELTFGETSLMSFTDYRGRPVLETPVNLRCRQCGHRWSHMAQGHLGSAP